MSIPVSIKEEKPRDNSLFDLSPKMGQWILFTMVRETWIESYEELSPHLYPRPVLASGCPSPAALCPLLLWLKRAGRFPAVWKDEGCRVTKRCLEPWYVYVCVCVCYCLACVGLSIASTDERVTGRKARGLQMEEIACKCQTFFSLLSGRRKQTSNIFSFSIQI